MYKKRLKAWGLSKHVKANEKEKALEVILHKEQSTAEPYQVRHDKLVRYARSRFRSGALDRDDLTIVKHMAHNDKDELSILRPHSLRHTSTTDSHHLTVQAASPPRSLILPDGPAHFDLFLRSMHAVIEREREEWLLVQQHSADTIFVALSKGLTHWHAGALTAACQSFGEAAQKVAEDIEGPVVLVSRITYCISSIVWGFNHEPVFLQFAHFMAKAAIEKLGHGCPMTVMLKHLRREKSLDAQLAIWACALDDYQISEQNVEHWWNMAQRRWRWCSTSGKMELAARCCSHAMNEARRIGRLTSEMESEAQHELELMALETES